jgi:TolB-like protein/DNA-binding winged helix-turn-helix (wHTH) protein/Tfp pilus assembly protein PilF
MRDPTQAPAVRRFGAFEINLQSGELRKNGMRLRLSGQPFQVLAILVERPGEVVTREELHSKLWPADTFVDFDHGLNNAVARIREVLDDSSDAPRYVETLPRRGYRFIAPLADVQSASTPSPEVESSVNPAHTSTNLGDSGHSVVPAKGRFSSTHLRVLVWGIAVLAVSAVALVLYRDSSARGTRLPAIKSLAVLPLKNLSGDSTQEYLADGMTEELIGRLAGIHDLRVVSRTSVMRFKDQQLLSVPEIARTLDVDAVVEGSVIREGSRIRVHAQLIRGATDEHFWSESYDRDLRDVLGLQSEVAESIALKVKATVTGEERTRLTAARPVSPDVYESYLKGLYVYRNKNSSRAGVEESIAYFQKAIARDPTYAPAYVSLANAYGFLSTVTIGGSLAERLKAMTAVRKALELDPNLAEAHIVLAGLQTAQWHWSEAEAEYRRGLELSPSDARAYGGLAGWLLIQGRLDEAVAWARKARELDPSPGAGSDLGWILFNARRYDEAIREYRSALAIEPDNANTLWRLGFALSLKHQSEEAITLLERAVSISDRAPGNLGVLAVVYGQAGRGEDALRVLAELKRRQSTGYIPAGAFVLTYSGLADREQTLNWLEQAYKEQSLILLFLKVHPIFDSLRDDPRFKDLLHRVGLD